MGKRVRSFCSTVVVQLQMWWSINKFEILHCGLRAAEDSHFKNLIFKATESDVKIVKLKMIDMIDLVDRCNSTLHQEFPWHPCRTFVKRSPVDGILPFWLNSSTLHTSSFPELNGVAWRTLPWTSLTWRRQPSQTDAADSTTFVRTLLKRLTKQNPSPTPRVLVKRDRIFYDCLKSVGSQSANDVGQVFINIARRSVLSSSNLDCVLEERTRRQMRTRSGGR